MSRFLDLAMPLWTGISASLAFGSTQVNQTLNADVGGVKYTARHVWSFEDKKFRLDVSTSAGDTSYIFNGRTFYICSALDQKQIDFLMKNNVNAPQVLNKFKAGACQIVPSNFMARFFLSPTDAVESIDRTDGMRLTLALDSYKVKPGPAKESKCTPYTRNYKLTKSGEDKKFSTIANEVLCNDHGIQWREGLWREVSKTVLRQPGGSAFMQTLRVDNAKIKGLPLTARIEMTSEEPGGKKIVSVRSLSTQSVTQKKFAKTHFSPPRGFEIFSPEAVARDLTALTKSDNPKSDKPKPKTETDTFSLPSILLCAISGSFVCLK